MQINRYPTLSRSNRIHFYLAGTQAEWKPQLVHLLLTNMVFIKAGVTIPDGADAGWEFFAATYSDYVVFWLDDTTTHWDTLLLGYLIKSDIQVIIGVDKNSKLSDLSDSINKPTAKSLLELVAIMETAVSIFESKMKRLTGAEDVQ